MILILASSIFHDAAHANGKLTPAKKQKYAATRPSPRMTELQIIFVGQVVSVIDGDTLSIRNNNHIEKVRLWGVDAPELRQRFGPRAKQFTNNKVLGKPVQVRIVGVDRANRSLAIVNLSSGLTLNVELVRAGLAWWIRQEAPKEVLLQSFEKQARAARSGLWRDKAPIAPWVFLG